MHKIGSNFFSKLPKISCHFFVKFYEEQFYRTSLSLEKSFKGLKIDFFYKTLTFHRNLHKNDYNFFLGSQKSYMNYHFIVKFNGEQFCRASLSPEKLIRVIKC